jgi:crossover junction endodeoxyribonuclease RuvC
MRFVGIDPASKTGFVALDEHGQVLREKELTGIGDLDPKRMTTLIFEIVAHLKPGDIVCIEGFPYDTQKAMFAGGLHHGIRNELYKRKLSYYEAAPNAVKKFVGVTGWVGEKGSKKRLTGPQKKRVVMQAVYERFGFEHRSDNVVDAYILARIAMNLFFAKKTGTLTGPQCQLEVIDGILNPKPKTKKKRKGASKK